jgi:hypothetical protein
VFERVLVELKSDGTFFMKRHLAQASGKYSVEGMTLPTGQADRAKIEGNKITKTNGQIWTKK